MLTERAPGRRPLLKPRGCGDDGAPVKSSVTGIAVAVLLGACSRAPEADRSASPPAVPAAAANATAAPVAAKWAEPPARAVLQLGKKICGVCCLERVHKALDGTPGLARIDMEPGDVNFVVAYDPEQVTAEQLAEKLVQAGEEGARVAPYGTFVDDRAWVRPK